MKLNRRYLVNNKQYSIKLKTTSFIIHITTTPFHSTLKNITNNIYGQKGEDNVGILYQKTMYIFLLSYEASKLLNK